MLGRVVLMVRRDERVSCRKVDVDEEEMEEMDKFQYLGVVVGTNGGFEVR